MGEGSAKRLDFYPFAYALITDELETYCWYCLEECPQKRHCTGCGMAIFCNKQCQTLGWKDHKAECKGFRTVEFLPDIEVRLLGRIVLRYKTIEAGKDKEDPTFYQDRTSKRSVMEIWTHTEEMKTCEFDQKKFNEIFANLEKFYDKKFLLPRDVVFELHCRNYINRHAISDKGYMREIGKGLYLDLCSYDHSCRPTAIYTCTGFKATLRALNSSVNLNDHKQTFYTYIDLLCSQQQRRKLLKDTWYFTCECERCMDPEDHLLSSILCPKCPDFEKTEIMVFGSGANKDPLTQMITCKKCDNMLTQDYVLEGIGAMRFIERVFDDKEVDQMPGKAQLNFLQDLLTRFERVLPHINVYYCKIIQELIARTAPSDNRELLRLHLMSERCVRHCFPHNHPAVAFHLRNIGIFSCNLGNKEKGLRYFEEAQNILDFTLDPEHPMSTQNRALWEQSKAAAEVNGNTKKMVSVSLNETENAGTVSEEKDATANANEDNEHDDDMPELINE